jgi:hypothetical protein
MNTVKQAKPALPTFNPFAVKGYTPKPIERNYFLNIGKIRDLKALRLEMKNNFPASLSQQLKALYRDCSFIEQRLGWVYTSK